MNIKVNVKENPYEIVVGKDLLSGISKYVIDNHIDSKIETKKVIIVTDTSVPKEYINILKNQFDAPIIRVIESGEHSKNLLTFTEIHECMLDNDFSRYDTLIAVGGGMVGDISAFVTSTYMRGIEFINIPTTLLAQIDSAVGGKTAVNLHGIKNVVGTFYQPSVVFVDIDTLKSLNLRQFINGFAEIIKIAITFDENLFKEVENLNLNKYYEKNKNIDKESIESCEITKRIIEENYNALERIIIRAIELKKVVVEKDTKEKGLRRVLNFGHTIGHGIEGYYGNEKMLHGECISIGITYMVTDSIRDRVIKLLNNVGLPTSIDFDLDKVLTYISHDKKRENNKFEIIESDKIGTYKIKTEYLEDIKNRIVNFK